MRLFDFSLLVGADPYSPAEATRDALVGYLDAVDAGGIVTSLAGLYYDFEEGNRETLEIVACDRRLLAGFTIDPRRTGCARIDLEAVAAEYRAIVLFASFMPGIVQGWSLSHPALPVIAQKASAAGLPMVVYAARSGDVQALARLALDVDVPVIALGVSYGAVGEVVAGAAGLGNLLFGVSLFAGLDNIETLAAHLGPERLVYNSGEPRFDHGPSLAMLEAAQLDAGSREFIAIGNARRIFGGKI